MAGLRLEGVSKVFPDGTRALDDVSLEAADGELLVLVGPSGCGKSTAMRIVAGLDAPTAGKVVIGDREVTRMGPQERDVAMVFQSYALYPHKTVRDNLGFGLRVRGVARADVAKRVGEVAEVLELTPLLARKPGELSGGQRQRVALGRAIARAPRLFLLDEPLSNLDARLRLQTRAELGRLQRRLGTTMLYVTHDQEEAMTLGARIAVMRAGRVEQIGTPLEVYERPVNVFVAGFLGAPPMSFVRGGIVGEKEGDRIVVGVRPHDASIVADGADGALRGRVEWTEALGRDVVCHVRVGDGGGGEGPMLRVLVPPAEAPAPGATVGVRLVRERLHRFDAQSERRVE
jgi:multiple sugar transport system ATP-binding protein